jgi:aspartyl aminopeptidase
MNFVEDLLHYLEHAAAAVLAVDQSARRLAEAGFVEWFETDAWTPKPGDAFFVRRGRGCLAAGIVGEQPPAESGFRVVGAHSDVPALRLKPQAVYSKEGYRQLGVEVYGGPILATWADRDLALAGYVVASPDYGEPRVIPVHLKRPVCRIPNAALHLNRKVNDDGLKLDRQKHLPAIFALDRGHELKDQDLRQALAEAAGVETSCLLDYCVDLVDAQPPALGGLDQEFLFARGVDNLVSCHAAVWALIDQRDTSVSATRLVVLFDNEEVGSATFRGAASTLVEQLLERLCQADPRPREAYFRAIARSLLVSADGAHAVHPNYADLHEPAHKPKLGGGPVLKTNADERYATTAATRTYLTLCAEAAEVPVQHFVTRSDLPCGSTIGPISATRLGLPAVDVGAPMLSMHSIRETTTPADCEKLAKLLGVHLRAAVDPVR